MTKIKSVLWVPPPGFPPELARDFVEFFALAEVDPETRKIVEACTTRRLLRVLPEGDVHEVIFDTGKAVSMLEALVARDEKEREGATLPRLQPSGRGLAHDTDPLTP